VRVLNVDSQTSLNNIVVQVIGVMSNKSAPSKKFVQTFVLTPQTNGYYVLNDIFRYLNDEEDEIIEDEPVEEQVSAEEASGAEPRTADTEEDSVSNEVSAEQVDAKLEEVVDTDAAQSVNGAPSEPAVEEPVVKEASPEISEEEVASVPAENPPEPVPTPARTPPKAATPALPAEVPPVKKTWANLVGSRAAAVPAVPTPTPAVPSQPKAQRSSPPPVAQPQQTGSTNERGTSPASQGNEWQTADHSKRQSRPQSRISSEGNVLGYIKNVTEKIEASKLRSSLEKFGEIKYFDVSRPRVGKIFLVEGS
jgi:Nuclear transport factor 2 (NTF2) domain